MQTEVYYSFLDGNFRNLWYNGKHTGFASPTQTQGVSAVQTQTVIILPLQLTVTAIGLVPCGTDKSFGVRWIQSGILLAADDFTSYKEKQNWSPETITSKENHHQHLFLYSELPNHKQILHVTSPIPYKGDWPAVHPFAEGVHLAEEMWTLHCSQLLWCELLPGDCYLWVEISQQHKVHPPRNTEEECILHEHLSRGGEDHAPLLLSKA